MPPSGFNEKAIRGLLQFVEACYEDMQKLLKADPKLSLEQAIEMELKDIRRALESFSLNEKNK
jgi:hypothetical protein